MSEQKVEAVLDHIKVALGPLPWEERQLCKECLFLLLEGEEELCVYCKDEG